MNKNFKTAVALDFNSFATNTFKQNMPDCEVVTGDITDENVRKFVIEKSKELKVNMVIGGPPCQGYSLKGKNLGLDDERNFLFQEYLKIIEELQPEVFIIENVKNILASANGWFKDQIIERVTNMGYFIECGVLNSKDFGVPQMRQRAFFLCSKTKKINLPKNEMENYITVKEAISDLSYLNSGEGSFESKYLMDAQSEYQKVMRENSDKLYNHQATKHSEIALTKLSLIKAECGKECLPTEMHGKQIFATTWGRLKWNDISPTIDTRFDTPSNGTNSHPELNRSITPREAARIQSFPDTFIFYGNKTQICKQIGNAVPPLLAKAIGDKIIDEYNDKK
jgi:DNA (cytosine-5)-methyltransferase 1/site-specific DNA-methyltransferase (adenine-specific)